MNFPRVSWRSYEQEFFGAFFQKRTAACILPHHICSSVLAIISGTMKHSNTQGPAAAHSDPAQHAAGLRQRKREPEHEQLKAHVLKLPRTKVSWFVFSRKHGFLACPWNHLHHGRYTWIINIRNGA
jgi:hypothetical protein